jgi:ribonuclease P/MRP protein subunit POP1
VKMLGRGAPDDLANIYRIDDAEAKKWIKEKDKRREGTETNEVHTLFTLILRFEIDLFPY